MQLRDYQSAGIHAIREQFRRGAKRVCYVLPTGGGKTLMFSHMAHSHIAKHSGRVTILVHRAELIDQVVASLREFGDEPAIMAGGQYYNPFASITVASVQTLYRRLHKVRRPTLLVIDECHHAISRTTWGKVAVAYAGVPTIGVTATPTRLSGEGLDDLFDALVVGPSTQELIDAGYLSPVTVYAPSTIDVTGIRTRMGDYIRGEVIEAVDKPTITGDAVEHYRKLAEGKQFLAFCAGVEHAKHVAAQFTEAGFPCVAIDGTTDAQVRRRAVFDFKRRAYRGLASADIFTEGFDVPGVECGVMLRPTKSLVTWLQSCGRCLRTSPGKDRAIILDHAGNTLHHGLPTDSRDWTLAGKLLDSTRADNTGPSVRVCLKCFGASRGTAQVCGLCGEPFPVKPRKVSREEGELKEITPEQAAAIREHREARRAQGMSRSFDALVELGRTRGYRDPAAWAKHVYDARMAKGRA
jgi:superfamily II DNA or RNA helicase